MGAAGGRMRRRAVWTSLAAGAALLVSLGGCAPSLHRGERADMSTLTSDQMAPNHFHTAYEAVEAMRSNWFAPRTNTQVGLYGNNVLVYLDNIRLGGIAELQNIPIASVAYIRHFDGVEATTRWGFDHMQGVIYVSTHPLGSAAAPSGG